jgi:hypothetical protein
MVRLCSCREGLWVGLPNFDSRPGQEIFLHATNPGRFRGQRNLMPSEYNELFPMITNLSIHLELLPRSGIVALYHHSYIHIHGTMLNSLINSLSTLTCLHFFLNHAVNWYVCGGSPLRLRVSGFWNRPCLEWRPTFRKLGPFPSRSVKVGGLSGTSNWS